MRRADLSPDISLWRRDRLPGGRLHNPLIRKQMWRWPNQAIIGAAVNLSGSDFWADATRLPERDTNPSPLSSLPPPRRQLDFHPQMITDPLHDEVHHLPRRLRPMVEPRHRRQHQHAP